MNGPATSTSTSTKETGEAGRNFRRYGFVSAGGGPRWSSSLRKLQPGGKIYAYQKGRGYVGLGEVVAAAVPAKDFTVGETGTPILDEDLSQPGLKPEPR